MEIKLTKDAALLAKLNQHVHDLHVEAYPDYFKPYNYELIYNQFEQIMNKETFEFLIIEDQQIPVGYAWIEYRTYLETAFKLSYQSVYIHQISISNHVRGKGYGTKLMEEVNRRALEKNIHKIELDYWSNNEIAKNFYKKLQFKSYVEHVYKDI